jgi:predicted methyltransferase
MGFASPVYAQAQSVDPGINAPFRHPDFETWVARFERPGREVYDQREAITNAAGVKSGMAVADIGAGTGLYTLLFAQRVGAAGRVYAVDISQVFVDNILRRARAKGFNNVAGVVDTATDVKLAPNSIDLAFVCDTYHHFEYPQKTLASIHRALRKGGALVIVDYRRKVGVSSSWVLGHVRAGKAEVIREIEAAGFRLAADRDQLLKENYFLRFTRVPVLTRPDS